MILCDDRVGSKEMQPIISQLGIPCELSRLPYGDACFEGNGPKGLITVGIERKTLNDMLNCIEDARYAGHQLPGMMGLYSKSYLCLEGMWAPGNGNGFSGMLMQGFRSGASWGPLKTQANRTVLYSKLYRYLMSISLAGVIVSQSHGVWHTAYNVCEMYQYFQKKWHQHTSLMEVQKLAIPVLTGKPSLALRWATNITDVGVIHGMEAERKFKTGREMANATEDEWMEIPGVGMATAKKVVKEIREEKRWR